MIRPSTTACGWRSPCRSTRLYRGASWTTDAPFRETPNAIGAMRGLGVLAVEMEASALYAFARAQGRRVLCFAHVTYQMGPVEGDFEKGQQNGAEASLELVQRALVRLAPPG